MNIKITPTNKNVTKNAVKVRQEHKADDNPCTPFIECHSSISSDVHTSPTSSNSESFTNIPIMVTSSKHNNTFIFREDDLSKIVHLEIENNRVMAKDKEIEIKKQRDTERKEELQRENKIIKNKEELSQCINNELESECKVILMKSILNPYLNDKLEGEKMKIKDENNQFEKEKTKNVSSVNSFKSEKYKYNLILNMLNYFPSMIMKSVILIYDAIRVLLLTLDVWQYRRAHEINLQIEQEIIEIKALNIKNARLDIEYRNWLLFVLF